MASPKNAKRKYNQDRFVHQMNIRLAHMARNQNLFTTVLKLLVTKGIISEDEIHQCLKEAQVSQQNGTQEQAAPESGRPAEESGDSSVAGDGQQGLLFDEGDRAAEQCAPESTPG